MEFREITFDDKERIDKVFRLYGVPNCESSFGNLMAWNDSYPATICETDNFLIMKCYDDLVGTSYTMPMGDGNPLPVLRKLEKEAEESGVPLRLYPLRDEDIEYLRAIYPDFHFYHFRERDEYVYHRYDLVNLTGRKFKSKRHLSQKFHSLYNWEYTPLTQSDAIECLELTDRWRDEKMDFSQLPKHLIEEYDDERRSIVYSFDNFEKLALIGGKIKVDGHLAAFCYGSTISEDTFCVYVEKADRKYEGVFTVISQQFALHLPEKYIFIDWEYDCGLPGLREAKELYHPAFMLRKWIGAKVPPSNGIKLNDEL